MTDYDGNLIRENYLALCDIKKIFEDKNEKAHCVEGNLVREYEKFLQQAGKDLPSLLIELNPEEFFMHSNSPGSRTYRSEGMLVNISRNLSKLKVKIDDSSSTPATINKSFHFISNTDIRKIVERDYLEIQRSVIASNWKSTILLCGGSIEAILLDLLGSKSSEIIESLKAPPESDINKWDLNNLIEVAVDRKLVDAGMATLSHSVREYRNLIHPGVEIRKGLKIEPEEAKIALEVLNMLIRELS